MYAIHSTLLPPSAVHHTLYLPHFTPSTIYPLPRPSTSTAQDVKVVGNLVLAGLSDLRIFEVREEQRPVPQGQGHVGEDDVMGEGLPKAPTTMVHGEELGDSFFDTGPTQVRLYYLSTLIMHLMLRSQYCTDALRERRWHTKHTKPYTT
jgi:cleavage and polyadenylation specificity factor subunit 1